MRCDYRPDGLRRFVVSEQMSFTRELLMKVQPVIEVYFDPYGIWGGKYGCFRCRLRDSHGLHDAADSPEYAVKRLVQNIVCHADYKENGTLKYAHLPHTPET